MSSPVSHINPESSRYPSKINIAPSSRVKWLQTAVLMFIHNTIDDPSTDHHPFFLCFILFFLYILEDSTQWFHCQSHTKIILSHANSPDQQLQVHFFFFSHNISLSLQATIQHLLALCKPESENQLLQILIKMLLTVKVSMKSYTFKVFL